MLTLHRTLPASLLALVLMAQPLPAAPATRPVQPDRKAVLARQRAHYLQTVNSLPLLDQHQMIDVLQLKVENGQIEFHTPLTPWPDFESHRLQLEGSPSPATVMYAEFVANNPRCRQFEFKVEDYVRDEIYGQLHMQWRPTAIGIGSELSIEHTEQTSHGFLRAFYMQTPTMARLLVFANDASADGNTQSFNYTARDFLTLQANHPSEVQQWLRPMLHRLQQDAVFAPDVNAAWQALASDWQVQPQVQEKVLHLLPDLNSGDFRKRNRAADDLSKLGLEGASAISRLDRREMSLEQNIRLDEVLARFRRLPAAQAAKSGRDPDFLLDCQYCANPTIRDLAARRLAVVTGHPVELDPSAPDPARFEAIEALRARLHPISQDASPE